MDDELYRDLLIDHAKHPRHCGLLEGATFARHEANASCGDALDLFVLADQDGRIMNIGCVVTGCVISRAAASLFAEWATGKHLDDVLARNVTSLPHEYGVSVGPMRLRCATLAAAAFVNGVSVWKRS